MDPNSDEYYKEVDKRMRIDFPHKFGTTEPKVTTKPSTNSSVGEREVQDQVAKL